jgi:hypothetical protein
MTAPRDLADYLDMLVGIDLVDTQRHIARSVVLELLEQLDQAVDLVLATTRAVNVDAASHLAQEVFSRLPGDLKLRMIAELLDDRPEVLDAYPFVPDVLPKVYRLRHAMAHGVMERLADGRIRILSRNRGWGRAEDIDPGNLGWLVWQTQVMRSELLVIGSLVVPDVDDWYGPDPLT